jgi:hypothetical protein
VTVVARSLISIPERSATATWEAIVQLIAPHPRSAARRDLDAVAGVACSCITDEALANDPLVVHGVGPRLRIYALYGDDAVEGDRADESVLSYVPTDGDWRMSIPCLPDDLAWVQSKLKGASGRVTARELGAEMDEHANGSGDRCSTAGSAVALVVDRDVFFRRKGGRI